MLELVLQIIRKRNRGEHNFQANSSHGSPNRMDTLLTRLAKSVNQMEQKYFKFSKHKFCLRATWMFLNAKDI